MCGAYPCNLACKRDSQGASGNTVGSRKPPLPSAGRDCAAARVGGPGRSPPLPPPGGSAPPSRPGTCAEDPRALLRPPSTPRAWSWVSPAAPQPSFPATSRLVLLASSLSSVWALLLGLPPLPLSRAPPRRTAGALHGNLSTPSASPAAYLGDSHPGGGGGGGGGCASAIPAPWKLHVRLDPGRGFRQMTQSSPIARDSAVLHADTQIWTWEEPEPCSAASCPD
ncbi:uncharacterized protein [Castor canadensis]|uniref:Uncharacterized protein n=1 Tax=Castor canadensis TaxID=51338 RepID=A0AC58M8F4_CASCN